VVDELARRLDPGRHLGEAELHRLVLEDGLAERDAFLGVRERGVERGARHADRLRADADAPAFEAGERDLQALPFFAEQVLGRDAAALEDDLRGVARVLAGLLLEPRDRVARRRRRHDEGADAALAGGLVGHRHHDRDVAVLAAGDELLDAVEDVGVAVAHRGRSQARPPPSRRAAR
jgi:hypothetical protein